MLSVVYGCMTSSDLITRESSNHFDVKRSVNTMRSLPRKCHISCNEHTTMKSWLAPSTRTSREASAFGGTGSDALSFLRSNNAILELSVISFWYLKRADFVKTLVSKEN